MTHTERAGECVLRLPLWLGMDAGVADAVAQEIERL
jgi:hypothetical protein